MTSEQLTFAIVVFGIVSSITTYIAMSRLTNYGVFEKIIAAYAVASSGPAFLMVGYLLCVNLASFVALIFR